jgi:hypothetical protein
VTVFLVAAFVIAGCQAAPIPGSQAPSSGLSGSQAPHASAATPAPSAPPAPPTSEALIARALASGSITEEQSLEYRALALFGSADLPAQFQSAVLDLEAASALLGEIDDKAASLSPAALAQLAPYRVRPSDPASIFNTAPRAGRIGAGAAVFLPVADATPAWKSALGVGGKIRVWVKDSATADADIAEHLAQVEKVWASYPGIFTYPKPDQAGFPSAAINPDSAVDIYFANVGDIDPRRANCVTSPSDSGCILPARWAGYAVRVLPFAGSTSSGALVIDAGRSANDIIDTIAHELAHTAQFAYDRHESSWLMESTATWVAFKVDKKLGITPTYQYAWLPLVSDGLGETLTRSGDNNSNSYASWLYFLYASMEAGDAVVTDIWKTAAADGEQGAKAVDKIFPFADHFAGYALRDWNADPVKPLYKSVDATFPGDFAPRITNSVTTLYGGEEDSLEVNLPPLASSYYRYDFAATTLDVTFQNTLAGNEDARVWAIKQIDGVWKAPEDWTNLESKKFCRNIDAENISQLVLVVSNKNMTADLTAEEQPKLVAGTTGCSGWSGTMTATETWALEGGHGTSTAAFSGAWVADPAGNAYCDPSAADSCTVFRPEGTISWTWDSHHGAYPTCDATTNGTLAAGDAVHPDQQAFYLQPIDATHMQYWGIGGFGIPDQACTNLVTASHWPPAYFDIRQEWSASNPADGTGGNCSTVDWQVDPKTDAIKGSCTAYVYAHETLKFEWSLVRVGPTPGS